MTLDLDPIRARLAAATPGPWERVPAIVSDTRPADCYDIWAADDWLCANIHHTDAALIANAPADMAALLAEVERLRETVAHVRGVAESWRDGFGPGSHVEGVMGRQVVSVDHATSTILAALDGAS